MGQDHWSIQPVLSLWKWKQKQPRGRVVGILPSLIREILGALLIWLILLWTYSLICFPDAMCNVLYSFLSWQGKQPLYVKRQSRFTCLGHEQECNYLNQLVSVAGEGRWQGKIFQSEEQVSARKVASFDHHQTRGHGNLSIGIHTNHAQTLEMNKHSN